MIARLLLWVLLLGWLALGAHIISVAPFRSGTDESINYVAFAAAKNRWATEADFHKHQIDYFYYPPLYFLSFAPFWGDVPSFVEDFPHRYRDPDFMQRGGRVAVTQRYLASVPRELDWLYRSAKFYSLICGMGVLGALIGTVRRLARSGGMSASETQWTTLIAVTPLVFLPQFLYYHTLCDNDALCNVLSAGTIYCFVAALTSLGAGRPRAHVAWSGGAAVCAGLALLTKLTGLVPLALLGWLAVSSWFLPAASRRIRLWRLLGFTATLAAIAIVFGGWWIALQAAAGDWSSQGAHRIAHPWAFLPRPAWELQGWARLLTWIVRSYFGLFSATSYGIPDRVFLVYLSVSLVTALAGAVWLARSVAGEEWRARQRGVPLPRLWLFAGLVFVVVVNVVAIIVNCREAMGAFGRLLFPSLVAGHVLFAWVWRAILGNHPRRWQLLAAILIFVYGASFSTVLHSRLLPAVVQRPEALLPISWFGDGIVPKKSGKPWTSSLEQTLVLAPGRMRGFRFSWGRPAWPQIGGVVTGDLLLQRSGDEIQRSALQPFELGDSDATDGWEEMRLEHELALERDTVATLSLQLEAPWFPPVFPIYFVAVDSGSFPRAGELRVDGRPTEVSLCLSVVYAPAPEAPPR